MYTYIFNEIRLASFRNISLCRRFSSQMTSNVNAINKLNGSPLRIFKNVDSFIAPYATLSGFSYRSLRISKRNTPSEAKPSTEQEYSMFDGTFDSSKYDSDAIIVTGDNMPLFKMASNLTPALTFQRPAIPVLNS